MQINFKLKFSKQEDSVLIAIVCLLGIIHSFMYIDTMKGSLFEEYYFIATSISLTCIIGLWRMKIWAFFPAPARIPSRGSTPRESLRVVLQFKILKNTNIV